MTDDARRRLREARDRVLRSQTKCAWCGAEYENSDDLADHILLEHAPEEDPAAKLKVVLGDDFTITETGFRLG
jgi:hypothetical protein